MNRTRRPGAAVSRCVLASLAAVALLLLTAPASFAQWRLTPDLRLGGGHESGLVVDPGLTRTVIEGGPFMELGPSLSLHGWLGERAMASLGAYATFQQFINDQSRFLFAQTGRGDLIYTRGVSRTRVSAYLTYFDDSQRETVRRLGGGTELGLGLVQNGWFIELSGGRQGRRYPNITVTGGAGPGKTYQEQTWSGGMSFGFNPAEAVQAQLSGYYQRTDSDDPLFDSRAWTGNGFFSARLAGPWRLILSGTYQDRKLTNRPAGSDKDSYYQIGSGVRCDLTPDWSAALLGGYSSYTWTDGVVEDSHRLTLEIRYRFSRGAMFRPPRVDVAALVRESGGSVQQADPAGNILLRVHAPAAAAVQVAGEFNGWKPDRSPLRPLEGGWWEVRLSLQPGSYEYVYVIDGQWTVPPEAKRLVDDGFGGQNGILEVLPHDM